MTRSALGFVEGHVAGRLSMRIMAGQATQRFATLGVAAAEGEREAGRANELRVRRVLLDRPDVADDVAAATVGHDGRYAAGTEVDDRQVVKSGLSGRDVVCTWAMTAPPLVAIRDTTCSHHNQTWTNGEGDISTGC